MYNNKIQETISLVNHKKSYFFRLKIETSFYFCKSQALFLNDKQ